MSNDEIYKKINIDEKRDLMIQLSCVLSYYGLNISTTYTPFVIDKELTDKILLNSIKNNWKRFEWKLGNEESIIYIKVYENRISTIRMTKKII